MTYHKEQAMSITENASIAQFAADHGAQPYEVAAFLNLGRDYDENAPMSDENVTILAEAWSDDTAE